MLHDERTLQRLPSGGALHVTGPRDGAPVLLMHGVGGAAWAWKHQRLALEATHRVFVWEARGHGDASPVADAGLSDYYTDAREALAEIAAQTRRPAFLVGHSMGGLLAVALACNRPHDVAGLFLVDPVYSSGDDYGHFSPRAGRVALFLFSPLLRSFERNGRTSRAISRWMFEHSFEDRARMEESWPDQRRQIPIEYPRMLRESFGMPQGFELRDFAAEISQPVYLLEGSMGKKHARFPKLIATLERRLGKNFTREWIPGGHYLQSDRPERVNERLLAFVRAHG